MGYGCQRDFHVEDFVESFRRTSPVKRTWERRSKDGLQYIEPDPLTTEERDKLLNLGALGLAGEGGEVVDLIKKHLFHGKPLDREKLLEEMGDQLFYYQCLLEAVDASFEEVVNRNDQKRRKRFPHGWIKDRANAPRKK